MGQVEPGGAEVDVQDLDVKHALRHGRLPAVGHDVERHAVGVDEHAAQHLGAANMHRSAGCRVRGQDSGGCSPMRMT